MNMRKEILLFAAFILMLGCQNNATTNVVTNDPNIHRVIALEQINTTQYTYLLANENGAEIWLALPLTNIKIGETYYYVNEMLMNNFASKELGRTFEKVYFIQGLFTEPPKKVNEGSAVNSNPKPLPQNHPQINMQKEIAAAAPVEMNANMHKGIALEKMNTTQYTYLLLNENGVKNWLALPLTDIKIGETYYYANEMLMTNFESKELKRTFEKVLFVPGIATKQNLTNQEQGNAKSSETKSKNMQPVPEKINVKIVPAKQGVSVAQLFSNKENFAGKKVVVKGKVTKFNGEIMGRNWIHIQDGTEHNGQFDLTITSQQEVKTGDVITFEGVISLNKDFGSGYRYDLILEDAIVK